MKTYLYNRVSSSKQNKVNKDGLARQSESADVLDFLKRNKLNVVKTMEYVGSSFHGKNFDNDTVLGKFVKAVESGEIASPVCLCFENWDRFGRDVEWKNTKRFLDLIHTGVSIGVVSMDVVIDQKVLAENSSILQLVVNDIQRARKESQRKSGFSKRNLLVKVNQAKAGERIYFGGQSPRWITGVKAGKFTLDVEMVESIKRIFSLYLNGNSCIGIAKIMNGEKLETFGVSKKNPTNKPSKVHWYNTTVRNILTHKSLTGWCKVNDFESDNYYPQIIPVGTFHKVQSRVDLNATNRGGSPSGNVINLFKGMLRCSCCGRDIGVRQHMVGKTNYSYMGCRKSHVNLCKDRTWWKTDLFEEQIFLKLFQQSPEELLVKPAPKANSQLGKLQTELGKINMVIKRLSNLANDPDLKEVAELQVNLTKANQQRNVLKQNIQQEEAKQAVFKTNPVSVLKLTELFNQSKSTVTEIDSEGNRTTDKIIFFPNDEKKAIEMYNKIIAEDTKTVRTSLRDNKVRAELKNIMPDLMAGIDINLAGHSFVVSLTNGTKWEMKYKP